MENPILKKARSSEKRKKNLIYLIMCLPALLYLILFHDVPMFGIVLAFKNYKHTLGIFGSEWIGLDNFKFFFQSNDAVRTIRNTICYHMVTVLLVNLVGGMLVAILLYEVNNRFASRFYQTVTLIPNYISWMAISYIAYLFLNPGKSGLLNQLLSLLGRDTVNWYNEPKYWPFIIILFSAWKMLGSAALYYFAALLNIDTSLYEAAALDGAGKYRQILYISVPELMPMACLVLITQTGGMLNSNFDMFYQLPMNSGALYPTTDVLSTYIYRGLTDGAIGQMAAVGLFQSVVGFILLFITNSIIRKINPENAMF